MADKTFDRWLWYGIVIELLIFLGIANPFNILTGWMYMIFRILAAIILLPYLTAFWIATQRMNEKGKIMGRVKGQKMRRRS